MCRRHILVWDVQLALIAPRRRSKNAVTLNTNIANLHHFRKRGFSFLNFQNSRLNGSLFGNSTISGFPRNSRAFISISNVESFGRMERAYNQYFISRLSVNFTKNTWFRIWQLKFSLILSYYLNLIANNSFYNSFKIFPYFWLVKTTRIIYHNQLLLAKVYVKKC